MTDVTVFDWLKNSNDYQLNDISLSTIAEKRLRAREWVSLDEVDPTKVSYYSLSQKEEELMLADMIRRAVFLSPSNTASVSISHAGFQQTIGSRSDTWRSDKINWANSIYKKYEDENAIDSAAPLKVLNPF